MKFLVTLCVLVVVCVIQVVQATQLRGRGIATIMQFGNSTVSDLEKRGGRGTW